MKTTSNTTTRRLRIAAVGGIAALAVIGGGAAASAAKPAPAPAPSVPDGPGDETGTPGPNGEYSVPEGAVAEPGSELAPAPSVPDGPGDETGTPGPNGEYSVPEGAVAEPGSELAPEESTNPDNSIKVDETGPAKKSNNGVTVDDSAETEAAINKVIESRGLKSDFGYIMTYNTETDDESKAQMKADGFEYVELTEEEANRVFPKN